MTTGPDLEPLTIAAPLSSRNPAICCPAPWQAEHLFARIGCTSRVKSGSAAWTEKAKAKNRPNRRISLQFTVLESTGVCAAINQ